MFEKFLKKSSWTDIVISIIFIIFGALLISKPNEIVSAISIVLGIVFIAMGVLKIIEYFTSEKKEDYLLTLALVTVIIGVIILCCSDSILSIFRIILSVWIILIGIKNFQTTLVWKEVKSVYWTVALILSMAMILAGIIIFINKDILFNTIGILIIVYAVLDIVDKVIFMKKIKNYNEE